MFRFNINDNVISIGGDDIYKITNREVSNIYRNIYFINNTTKFFQERELRIAPKPKKFEVGDVAFVNHQYDRDKSQLHGYMNSEMRTYNAIRIIKTLSGFDERDFQYHGVCVDKFVERQVFAWNDEMLFTKEEYLSQRI